MRKTILVPALPTAAPAVAHHAVNVAYDTEGEEIKPFQCATPDSIA